MFTTTYKLTLNPSGFDSRWSETVTCPQTLRKHFSCAAQVPVLWCTNNRNIHFCTYNLVSCSKTGMVTIRQINTNQFSAKDHCVQNSKWSIIILAIFIAWIHFFKYIFIRYDNVTLSLLLPPARVTNLSHSTYGSSARSDSHRAVFCPNSVVSGWKN